MAETKKLTDADLMTGFNPAMTKTAEEIEAEARQEDGSADEAASPEGAESATQDSQVDGGAASTAAETRDVTLDGRTFKAPKDIADAFTREINRRDGTRGAEMQQLRERLAKIEGAQAAKPVDAEGTEQGPPVPNPDLMIEDPKTYQDQLTARIRWEQEQVIESRAKQFEQGQAARDQEAARVSAWNTHVETFYAKDENTVLRENRDIVDMVLAQHREELAPLSVEEGFTRLGELARDRVAKLTGQAPEIRARKTPKPAVLEGGGRRNATTPAPAKKDEGPTTLSQAVNERRAKARQSFMRGTNPAPTTR